MPALPNNTDVAATWRYHNGTKHSYQSVRTNPHYLDWSNRPLPFKIYPTMDPIRLPKEVPQTGMAALSMIAENVRADQAKLPTLNDLVLLLYFSAGITRRKTYPGGEIFMRAAACTGALYEMELYLICGDLPELEAGVYQFAPAEFGLRKLRAGDFRGVLVDASGAHPAVQRAPLTVICSGTYWRNAWKYQARTYRHFGWDNGTILANLLAMCTATQLPATVVTGFADDVLNRLLDLDPDHEVAFSMVTLGATSGPRIAPAPAVEPLHLGTVPLSDHEVDYPAMRAIHAASSLATGEEVRAWRERRTPSDAVEPQGPTIALQPATEEEISRDAIERVILRRGSTRQFAREPIALAQLSTMLERSTRGFHADFHDPSGAQLNHMYVLVNAVEGLLPGAYYFHRDRRELELLKEGDFRRQAGYLGLEQDLPADASANVFFLADLNAILERYGNRGYRATQLEAGILGGRLYLAAYAQHLGASGLTFYDDDVVNLFSPHAAGKSAIFLTCLGKSALRKQ
ncbi:MAG: SagB family peptide dehydrogenase [Acidobacteriia bacterium]|nr:SagB family peptide dehydrogenase [Terriglobia bacterium]